VRAVESIRRVRVLGVYCGRDVAYIASVFDSLRRPAFHVTEFDKFEDSGCADWPAGMKGRSWSEAGFGEVPAIQSTRRNLERLSLASQVTLHQGRAEEFLAATDQSFDLIYIDTSHGYQTRRRTIELAIPRLAPGGIGGGDDFSDQGTWGVARAVREAFERFDLHANGIWWASPAAFRAGN